MNYINDVIEWCNCNLKFVSGGEYLAGYTVVLIDEDEQETPDYVNITIKDIKFSCFSEARSKSFIATLEAMNVYDANGEGIAEVTYPDGVATLHDTLEQQKKIWELVAWLTPQLDEIEAQTLIEYYIDEGYNLEYFQDKYCGKHESDADFAEDYMDNCISQDVKKEIENYQIVIDWDATAENMMEHYHIISIPINDWGGTDNYYFSYC